MTETIVAAPETAARRRHKKRPHDLHLCGTAEELAAALRARDLDPVSLVREFLRPAAEAGILFTGSIAQGIATPFSDLDLWVLLPGPEALRTRLPREIAGHPVNHLPIDTPGRVEVSFYPAGIEVDITFVMNPALERASDGTFMTRLATGWIVDGAAVVERWRERYGTARLRMKWMADDFTLAAKNLEDLEAGIGRVRGHVPAVGAYCAARLLRALLACRGTYTTSVKWMLSVGRLLETADAELREALLEGRELAFPGLLEGAAEERAYFERVHRYCGVVKRILSREEGMADILDSVIHDLDIIA